MNWIDFKNLVCEPNAISMFRYIITFHLSNSIVKKEQLPFWSTFQTWCNLFSHCLSMCTITWLLWKIQLQYPLPKEWHTFLHVNENIIKWHVWRVFPIVVTHVQLMHNYDTFIVYQPFFKFFHINLKACYPWIFSTFSFLFPSTRIAKNSEACRNN